MAPTQDPIPLVGDLAALYSKERLVTEGQRWDKVRQQFEQSFGAAPQYIARAPGRVNLMGDHVDHMRFSCLPAALEMDILMAFRVQTAAEGGSEGVSSASSSKSHDSIVFHIGNTAERFQKATFESAIAHSSSVQLEHDGPTRWANYFKVAFKGLHPHLPKDVLSSSDRPTRVDVLVDGTIPPESSLSSSAAMTTCSSIVVLEAFRARERISRREMAEVAIESERLVGVASGGMDQAASIFGVTGSSLHISFVPELKAEPVKLPDSTPPHMFVIANTLVVSDKKVSGPVQYNLRVGELRMACRVLCKKLDLPQDASTTLLKPLMNEYFAKHPLRRGKEADDVEHSWAEWGEEAAQMVRLRDLALDVLPQEPQTREQIEELSGYTGDAFHKEFLSEFPIRADKFDLYKRVRHVCNESLRVLRFKSVCQGGDASKAYPELGTIMHESQQSLFHDYDNGCPELETVCRLAEEAGALGSRPTGAGWGGSTVSLVEHGNVDTVLKALRTGYYDKKFSGSFDDEKFANAVLVSQPAAGACVYKV